MTEQIQQGVNRTKQACGHDGLWIIDYDTPRHGSANATYKHKNRRFSSRLITTSATLPIALPVRE